MPVIVRWPGVPCGLKRPEASFEMMKRSYGGWNGLMLPPR